MLNLPRHFRGSKYFLSIPVALTLLLMVLPEISIAKKAPDPEMIVEKADLIRFPSKAFQVNIKITTTVDDEGDTPDIRLYQALVKGNDKSIIKTIAPAIDAGQILLMREKSLWAFMPHVSQPIRLPLAQKLTGQVANGDLARAKFAGDYNAELVRTETIDEHDYYLLELNAKHRGVTYRRVLYWVDAKSYQPFKAEFYSLSNRLLKTCEYSGYKEMEGKTRPSRLIMTDALRKGERSLLEYTGMVERKLPDKLFTKDYLKKLK
jgi:outer membrane lipoprotein-sorting protein